MEATPVKNNSFLGQKIQDMLPLPKSAFTRTALIGACATLADMVALNALVELCGFSAQAANIPSLLAGSLVQFLGNRYISFEGARSGNAHKQALSFALAEGVAFILNATLFFLLVSYTEMNITAARALGTFLVFICFSYPTWKIIFTGAHPVIGLENHAKRSSHSHFWKRTRNW